MGRVAVFVISIFMLLCAGSIMLNTMAFRPYLVKLGYLPGGVLTKTLLGEFRWCVGQFYTFKAVTYYGEILLHKKAGGKVEVEFSNLYKTLEAAARLNPYHEDIYYLAQAIFPWDAGVVQYANQILQYMGKYRYWDYKILFYLGFNYGYFLNMPDRAAVYFEKAAEKSGMPLYANLSAMLYTEAGKIELAIIMLENLKEKTTNLDIRKMYDERIAFLKGILYLERGVAEYRKRYSRLPKSLNELLVEGFITQLPEDPYGGEFFLDEHGRVRSTSRVGELWKRDQQ